MRILAAFLTCSIAAATPAMATPAAPESEPAVACTAPAPAPGAAFSGPVLQVLDGDRLCVASGPTPDKWVEVRPAGLIRTSTAPAGERRSVLMTAAFSKRLDCVAGAQIGGSVQAVCTIHGAALADEIQAAGARPAWQLWR